ncbi:hypothetical protein M8J76_004331 [Diaphorina citri]|nr:hypothetical protein M8J76_004331 [Diaphorina citri]
MASTTDAELQSVLALIQAAGSAGITDELIQEKMPDLPLEKRLQIFNKLIAQGLLDLFNQGGNLLYKVKDPVTNEKLKDSDNEEKVVYKIIEEAGNKGIWMRDIRFKSNLMPTQLNKILKQLETKKIIKAVKSVAASKKKVYMLFDLEPDRSLTGGTWYQDQDFEVEFVDVLNQQCYRFLQLKREKTANNTNGPLVAQRLACATPKEVRKFITDLGISKVELSEEDIRTILETLLFDGKIEQINNIDGTDMYRAVSPYFAVTGLSTSPCGHQELQFPNSGEPQQM